MKNILKYFTLLLVFSSAAYASKIYTSNDLSFNDLIRSSEIIVIAKCAFPESSCKSPDGKFLLFKASEVLKGKLDQLKDTLEVVNPELDLMESFKISQQEPIKKSIIVKGYGTSLKWEESFNKNVILFLSRSNSGEFHFAAPNGFEDSEQKSKVLKIIKNNN